MGAWQWWLMAVGVVMLAQLTALVQRSRGHGFARSFVMAVIGYGGLLAFILNIVFNS